MLEMIEGGAVHIGVATDHVIESLETASGLATKRGMASSRAVAQFHPLEEALGAMEVVVWPMIELEADDALASAVRIASEETRVEKVRIWTLTRT